MKISLDKPLVETTFAVLDLETSGGSPKLGAGITEIGVVKVKGGEVIGSFQSFVDPGHSLPFFITELTGITDQMLISAPFPWKEARTADSRIDFVPCQRQKSRSLCTPMIHRFVQLWFLHLVAE